MEIIRGVLGAVLMRKVEPFRQWAVTLGMAVLGAIFALILSQIALVQIADLRLKEYTDGLLAHAVEVAQASRDVLTAVNASEQPMCSHTDLNELRHLSFQSEHLRDVGRIQDGAIICTALWDKLTEPAILPPPQRVQHENDMLWADVPNIGELRLNVDMAGRGSAIVFTSPLAFRPYETRNDDLNALVLTEDGQHIYRTFGNVDALGIPADHPPMPWYDLRPFHTMAQCSTEVDICVVAGLDNVSVFQLPPLLTFALAFLGFMSGGSLGMAGYLHRNRRLSLPERIRQAIADDRLTVVYQPLIRLRDGRMTGVESLARLTDQCGEEIPPDVFIKVAEEHGFIGRVTRTVIRKALADMRPRLLAQDDFYCGINLSATDITDPALCDYLNQEVKRNGLDPRKIVLEITERSTAEHDDLIAGITAFRSHGYEFYIDDFGTGYSSLAYLAQLPINGIKIDRMFTQAIGREAVSSAIVENVSAIAEKLNLRLIVEGVETPEQAAHIKQINADAVGQGWLYGKPVSAQALTAMPAVLAHDHGRQ